MNYYIHNGIIHVTDAELDFTPLTEEQIQFFIDNPTADTDEVLNCQFKQFDFAGYKRFKIELVARNFTSMMDNNFDSVLTPLVYDSFKVGKPKATLATQWALLQADARKQKIQAITIARTKEEVDAVDCYFQNVNNPCSAEELLNESMGL